MPADLLLYALIAAGLVFWLRSILGTRDEDEPEGGSSSLFGLNDEDEESTSQRNMQDSNVVALAPAIGHGFQLPRHIRIDNKTTENALEDLVKTHPEFDFHHFLEGAQQAFPMIIEAFADGDKDTLEDVLSPVVYKAFAQSIDERNERGETVETEVKAVEKIDVTEISIKEDILYITLRFTAREVCVIRNKDNNIISGSPDRTTEMIDIWVFGRALDAEGPEWYLYGTRDDEIEDHKTPVPEAGKDSDKK